MTQDFAKPSTTRTAASAPQKRGRGSAKSAPLKKTSKTKAAPKTTKPKPINKKTHATPAINPVPKKSFPLLIIAKLTLLVGLISIAAWGIYLLSRVPPSIQTTPKTITLEHKKTQHPSKKDKPSSKIKDYTFYEKLPKAKVQPSKKDISTYQPKSKNGKDYLRYLQVGTFHRKTDAEAQRAKIAFLGIQATVKTTQTKSGKTLYRVQTLPYTSRSRLNGAIDKLVNINIRPLERILKQ